MKIRDVSPPGSSRGKKASTEECEVQRRRIDRALYVRSPFEAIYARNESWYIGRNDAMDDADRLRVPHLDLLSEIMSGPGEYRVVVNRLMAILAGHIAELTFRNPYARFRNLLPAPDDQAQRTKLVEYLCNFVMQSEQNELMETLEAFLLNSYLAYGTLEVAYLPHERTVDPDEYRAYGEIEADDDGSFDVVGGVPKVSDRNSLVAGPGGKVELETVQLADLFQLRSRHWRDVLFDPEGDESKRSHRWIADRFVIRLDEFLDDPLFTHKQGIEGAAKHIDEVYGDPGASYENALYRKQSLSYMARSGQAPEDIDAMRLFGWRIFDYRERRTKILIDDHDYLVYDKPTPHWIARSRDPYSHLMFHRRPGEWYPLTWVENWIPTGEMYNQLLGLKLRHTKRFLRKYQVPRDATTADELEKLKSHEDGAVVQMDDPSASIQPIADAVLDPTIFNDMNIAIRDGNEIASSSSEQRQEGRTKTATQSAIMEGHAGLKRDRNKAKYARAIGLAATKLCRSIQANLPQAVSFLADAPDGKTYIARATRAAIQGEFVGEVQVLELGTPDVDRQLGRLNQAIALWGPLVWQIPEFVRPYVDLVGIGTPGLAEAIVEKFKQLQADTLVLQQMRQGGYRGAGEAGKRELGQAGRQAGEGSGAGAGPGGGRQFGRVARPGA